jgi:ATP-binding protein involved in chromosome partitioning
MEVRVWEALKTVSFPGMSRDIVSFGFVDRVEVVDGVAEVELAIVTHSRESAEQVKARVEEVLAALQGLAGVEVLLRVSPPPSAQDAVSQQPDLVPGVRHIVAVASGKGGVGKSTVAANLAVRLGQLGHRTGILDADIYGPSVPMMFGINERPRVDGNRLFPFEKYGIRVMSLGFILDTDTPVIWRGPMIVRAIEQMLGDVEWGELDYLIVDLPPGTGDAQLTLAQKVPISGAVIVTTPQDVALIDARKGLAMFQKVNVPVIGIIENMSSFVCPSCGEETAIFKQGGGRKTAELLDCPYLGSVPLDGDIVLGGDAGEPIVVSRPDGPHTETFGRLANAVVEQTEQQQKPSLSIF